VHRKKEEKKGKEKLFTGEGEVTIISIRGVYWSRFLFPERLSPMSTRSLAHLIKVVPLVTTTVHSVLPLPLCFCLCLWENPEADVLFNVSGCGLNSQQGNRNGLFTQ